MVNVPIKSIIKSVSSIQMSLYKIKFPLCSKKAASYVTEFLNKEENNLLIFLLRICAKRDENNLLIFLLRICAKRDEKIKLISALHHMRNSFTEHDSSNISDTNGYLFSSSFIKKKLMKKKLKS